MPRWYLFVSTIALPAVVFACNDEVVQEVEPDVCVSGMQWIGGKRGSPEMFPGRDCVGCHLENDGPELMLGGTIYKYTEAFRGEAGLQSFKQRQTGEDCFGLEGVNLLITGDDGQEFRVTSNRAGNFFIEGKAADLVKPFSVKIDNYLNPDTGILESPPMGTKPYYGGCARCHAPGIQARTANVEAGESQDVEVIDFASGFIGIPSAGTLDKVLAATAQ